MHRICAEGLFALLQLLVPGVLQKQASSTSGDKQTGGGRGGRKEEGAQ